MCWEPRVRQAERRKFAQSGLDYRRTTEWITAPQFCWKSPRNTAKTVQSVKKISCLVPLEGSKTAEQTHKHRNRFEDYVCQKKIINNSDVLVGFVSVLPEKKCDTTDEDSGVPFDNRSRSSSFQWVQLWNFKRSPFANKSATIIAYLVQKNCKRNPINVCRRRVQSQCAPEKGSITSEVE